MARIRIKHIVLFITSILLVFVLMFIHSKLTTQINTLATETHIYIGFEPNDSLQTNKSIELADISELITDEIAFQGKQSIFIPANNTFQNIANINAKQSHDHYVSMHIVCNTNANPILVAQAEGELYEVSKEIKKHPGGWKSLQTEFFIPPNLSQNDIKVYIWNKENQDIWLDSLSISKTPERKYPQMDSLDFMHVLINNGPLYRLKSYREKAYEAGTITPESKKNITALINTDGRLKNVEMRLKGDWLDHLKGDKWSFRIKITEDSWKGMREFSVQSPATRDFLNEWFLHQIALDEGLLATRYGFINLYLNGDSKGVYAYEEHFKKQIVESANHREGPILKFDEFEFWDNIRAKTPSDQAFETTEIRAFGEKKIRKNPGLSESFNLGQNLLDHYRWQTAEASEIFDIEKTAKTFALLDCFYALHAFRWHNQRFYYNPVISRLQPIIFDCYVDNEKFNPEKHLLGLSHENPKSVIESRYMHLMKDPDFRDAYFIAIEHYSDTSFLKSYQKKYASDINRYETMIQKEFAYYHFDLDKMIRRAQQIRDSLPEFMAMFSENEMPMQYAKLGSKFPGVSVTKSDKINTAHCVNAYCSDGQNIHIQLLTNQEITLTGFGTEDRQRTHLTNQPEFSQGNIYRQASILHPDFDYDYLYFNIAGQQQKTKIISLPTPQAYNPRNELYYKYKIDSSFLKGNHFVISEGNHYFSTPLVIPKETKLEIKAGAKLHFSEGAGLLTFSPVDVTGLKNKPVQIISQDSISGYFLVFGANHQTDNKCKVSHCQFINQNTISYNAWTLTGAVTFYESDVILKNCLFSNNHSEDALNIIRSDFEVSQCKFENTFSDAFDSDFCTGKLLQSEYHNIGNDAIDFSGSQILINDCHMNNIGDKGISSGEQSYLIVNNCTISDAVTGMSAKDLSSIKGKNNLIDGADMGFLLLEKKLEFGPGTIHITESTVKNVIELHVIEMGSELKLNDKTYKGNSQNLKVQFY